VRLFERNAGILTPTDTGKIVICRAERIELDVDAVKTASRVPTALRSAKCDNRSAARDKPYSDPALPTFLQSHRQLQIELSGDPRNFSVTNREADIALRLRRPDKDSRVIAHRVGVFDYAVYAARTAHHNLPWIT
jgi:DNA-binding transcriptional LysR family regulator